MGGGLKVLVDMSNKNVRVFLTASLILTEIALMEQVLYCIILQIMLNFALSMLAAFLTLISGNLFAYTFRICKTLIKTALLDYMPEKNVLKEQRTIYAYQT